MHRAESAGCWGAHHGPGPVRCRGWRGPGWIWRREGAAGPRSTRPMQGKQGEAAAGLGAATANWGRWDPRRRGRSRLDRVKTRRGGAGVLWKRTGSGEVWCGSNNVGTKAGRWSVARGRGGAGEVLIEARRHETVVMVWCSCRGTRGREGDHRREKKNGRKERGDEQFLLGLRRGCARGRRRCTKMRELRFLPIWTSSEAAGAKT